MGRSRISMKFIEDRKARNISFKKRYVGLKKKAEELSTLCAIPLCMVVYGPPQELEIWESNPKIITVQDLLNRYRGQSAEEHRKTNVGVSDYFEDRNRKSESLLESLRRKNNAAKYPDWHAKFDSFLETELTVEAHTLNNKIEYMKMERDFMKEGLGLLSYGSLPQNQNQLNYLFGEEYPRPLAMIKPPSIEYPQMMLMNTDDNFQEFGGEYTQPIEMIRPPCVDPIMPMTDNHFQEFGGEYPQPIAIIRPPCLDMIDYNVQQFGGEYSCNNFHDHQLNYDTLDPQTIRGPSSAQFFNDPPELLDPQTIRGPSSAQFFNDPPELDYTPFLTSSQIDSAAVIDPALPMPIYGIDMSSSMNSSQLLLPDYNFQGKNY